MNELVKYANPLNDLDLHDFSVVEKRFFFTFLSLLREKPQEEIVLTVEQIRSLGIYADKYIKPKEIIRSMNRLVKVAYGMYFHDLQRHADETVLRYIHLFDEIGIRFGSEENLSESLRVYFKLHPSAIPFLEQMFEYTSFPLKEYQSLKRSYSQDLFIHLKQFKRTGRYMVSQEDLKTLLNIPKAYRQTDIDRRILKPAVAELSHLFPGLTYVKEKKGKDHRKVTGYVFTFQKEFPALPSSKIQPGENLVIEKGGSLPDVTVLDAFIKEKRLPFSAYDALSFLLNGAREQKIYDWKKYLIGCKDRGLKEQPHSKKRGLPDYYTYIPSDEQDPELLAAALKAEEEFNGPDWGK